VRRRALLTATAACWLAACATAPSQPANRREITAADILAVEPAVLRAAVLTDLRVLVQAVVIELRVAAQDERFVIRLQEPAAADPRLTPAPAQRAWQTFALPADGAAALLTIRQLLAWRKTEPGGVTVTVSAQPALVPADLLAALPLRIDLLVDNREGWFTQADGTLDLRR
jgi:predicted component of type VI protein secretion system